MTKTPVSLLERLRQTGDAESWARFVELYTPLLYHWACQVGLKEHDAADLMQDVLVLLVQVLPTFQYNPDQSFHGWLRVVTLNKWRENQRRIRLKAGASEAELDNLAESDPAEALWDAAYTHHLVGRALEIMRTDFQPSTWQACWQFVACGRPAAEVAAELGLTVKAVYLAKSRVLRRLRQELAGLMD
jgi:RNA polymerase sigma-70 factor, ECF subfamily